MIVLIDNYDSFTFNLVQYLRELGAAVTVVRNDAAGVDDLAALAPSALIVSPGPCDPDRAGISMEAIGRLGPHVPTLGVCLSHQCVSQTYGGRVVRASPRLTRTPRCIVATPGADDVVSTVDELRARARTLRTCAKFLPST